MHTHHLQGAYQRATRARTCKRNEVGSRHGASRLVRWGRLFDVTIRQQFAPVPSWKPHAGTSGQSCQRSLGLLPSLKAQRVSWCRPSPPHGPTWAQSSSVQRSGEELQRIIQNLTVSQMRQPQEARCTRHNLEKQTTPPNSQCRLWVSNWMRTSRSCSAWKMTDLAVEISLFYKHSFDVRVAYLSRATRRTPSPSLACAAARCCLGPGESDSILCSWHDCCPERWCVYTWGSGQNKCRHSALRARANRGMVPY
mmetsp:Transcript_12714/g.35137  ORF Transcript_12714/g.35137 Transcript_12714/m.35137 type:complete len:253 (+) Transcript_12714:85-843(+)